MEANAEIPLGSVAKLKKEAHSKKMASFKHVQMLANSSQYVFSMDQFLPVQDPPDRTPELDDLEKKPILIMCSDEEPAQTLCQTKCEEYDCLHTQPKKMICCMLTHCSVSRHPRSNMTLSTKCCVMFLAPCYNLGGMLTYVFKAEDKVDA